MDPNHHDAFDHVAFRYALDVARRKRGISWRELSREAGVSRNIGSDLLRGQHPGAGALMLLLHWLGTDSVRHFSRAGAMTDALRPPGR